MDWVAHLFSYTCGQAPAHTWVCGEDLLPCCQRCTGMYIGALISAVLHLWVRPRLDGRLLGIHGAFLLLMVPFGYHWLPQGPALRACSGVLFGCGLLTFLQLPVLQLPSVMPWRTTYGTSSCRATLTYFGGTAAAALFVPILGSHGGEAGFWILSLGSAAGALTLLGLAATNFALATASISRLACCLRRGKAADA